MKIVSFREIGTCLVIHCRSTSGERTFFHIVRKNMKFIRKNLIFLQDRNLPWERSLSDCQLPSTNVELTSASTALVKNLRKYLLFKNTNNYNNINTRLHSGSHISTSAGGNRSRRRCPEKHIINVFDFFSLLLEGLLVCLATQ